MSKPKTEASFFVVVLKNGKYMRTFTHLSAQDAKDNLITPLGARYDKYPQRVPIRASEKPHIPQPEVRSQVGHAGLRGDDQRGLATMTEERTTTRLWWAMQRAKDGKFASSVSRNDGPMRFTKHLRKATLSEDQYYWSLLPECRLVRVRTVQTYEVVK